MISITRRFLLAVTIACSGVLMAGASYADKVKVAAIYTLPVEQQWISRIHKALNTAASRGDIEYVYSENIANTDYERVMREYAEQGMHLIVGEVFGLERASRKVAKDYPDTAFLMGSSFTPVAPNFSVFDNWIHEPSYLSGMVAGAATKSNLIGMVGGYAIPEVNRLMHAFMDGAREVNPDVKLKIVWVYTWFDPAKEADAATALIEQGADIIMQHTDSPAAMTIAEEKGIYAFGQASDMKQFGPKARLSSIIDDWAPYYITRTQAVMDGTWSSTATWDGIKEGMVAIGDFSNDIPADVQASAKALKDALSSGATHSFTGPINKQDGSAWLAAGETADDGTLAGMNFYVEGVEGEVPN